MKGAEAFALDTESNSGFAYHERLCLMQVSIDGRVWLVDLLTLGNGRRGLDPMRELLESPETRVYLHGGEFDVGCLKRDYDISLRGVWDSQQAASYLGWSKTGYGAVVERVLDVRLPKEHAHYDWSRRPIRGEVLRYAINDVRYLPQVCRRLAQEVLAADLVEEIDLAFVAVEESTWNGGYEDAGFWRLKGVGKLAVEQRPLLFALYRWRNEIAQRLDLPAGRALNTELLMALARNPPANANDLRRFGIARRITRRWGAELLAVVADARRNPPEPPSRPARVAATKLQQRRGDRLRRWRRQEAERRGVPLQVVLPLEALKALQRGGADNLEKIPQLGGKRARLYGEQLRRLCRAD